MSANNRQPTELVVAKGKKHFTKDELEERRERDVKAPDDAIEAPQYLTNKQKKEFDAIAEQLQEIGIMANVDCDVLAMYVKSRAEYVEYGKQVSKLRKDKLTSVDTIVKYDGLRDRAFKRCMTAARELGLTITSRGRLVMPKAKESEEAPEGMKAFLMERDRVG